MQGDLVKRLRDIASHDSNIESNYIGLALLQAADAIEVLSKKEKTTQWIPVTERLPEMYEVVLVVNDDGMCQTAERTESFDTKDDWAIHYCLYDADAWDEDENGVITHWMPLPEPPKEGE